MLFLSPCYQSLIIFITSLVELILVPFTKVEESFNVQAVHDYLFLSKLIPNLGKFGLSSNQSNSKWDHEIFPGK